MKGKYKLYKTMILFFIGIYFGISMWLITFKPFDIDSYWITFFGWSAMISLLIGSIVVGLFLIEWGR